MLIGESDCWAFDAEFFHTRLQRGALESEVFGCAALSADFPVALHQHFFDVCSFNFFDGFACSFMRPKRNDFDIVLTGEPAMVEIYFLGYKSVSWIRNETPSGVVFVSSAQYLRTPP